jgi:hypothetical protein
MEQGFIIPEREYLVMDVAKRYYARSKVNEIKDCKTILTIESVNKTTQYK